MSSVNKAIILGNLGKDPEVRSTPGGSKVATLSVATSERWKDKNTGEQREQTEWHRVVIWNKLAEIAESYLSKGSKVYLEGKLTTRKWTDQKTGADRYTTEIIVSGFGAKLVFLGEKSGSGARTPAPQENPYAHQKSGEDFDDEVPF